MADKSKEACDGPSRRGKGGDSVVIRIAVDEKNNTEQSISNWSQSLNFNPSGLSSTETNTSQASLGRRRVQELRLERYASQSSSITSDDVPLKELPDNIPFFSGIPSVEVIKGIIHLFRDRSRPVEECTSEVLCVLGVPAHISLNDFLTFISASLSSLLALQVVRDSTPNQYMVLLTFKNKLQAEEFYLHYNMKRYSSMEKRICQLVYASQIEVIRSSRDSLTSPAAPSEGLTELPSCPVCLEKLDESVLTILCNHSFHTDCITRWEDSTCPVCRYTQIPEPSSENTCSKCDSNENLWICLVCGHVGCGRYHGGHAQEHFTSTQHTFSMQLGTQRVWDYIGDNYVHRLVQNKGDGKMVEIPGQEELGEDEKIDSLQLEYTYLLTSQLESQRLYFEEKLTRVEEEAREQISQLEGRCRSTVIEKERLEEKMEEERKEREKKYQQLHGRLTKVLNELGEEKELNKCMSDNQKVFCERFALLEEETEAKLRKKDKDIEDLREQVKDLMFALDVQQKISQSSPEKQQEFREGHMVVTHTPPGKRGGGGRGRRGKH
ncbi:PREDICTED: BRCA1-associated protein-like [Amphimedon queenslandica]|uniref:BRCA1-associated protein n=1 Tax=Amphimedon queenslandica TaxID=400682 RepID=A0A1X7U6F5_AMPQE|nr:PREDICTED: BRCA1-associated protein-like [Amphimedon queenslandica]|eukprot:XP_019855979.1 PREDICTED: BRCA1-associated protein-like [Amphimedon queenslandica]